jgi:hypothetical protein
MRFSVISTGGAMARKANEIASAVMQLSRQERVMLVEPCLLHLMSARISMRKNSGYRKPRGDIKSTVLDI